MKKLWFLALAAICCAGCDDSADNNGQEQVCGDGQVTGTEACDPGAVMTKTCRDFDSSKNWVTGVPGCAMGFCVLVQGSCMAQGVVPGQNQVCGDGQVTGTEACDPGAVMTKTCRDFDSTRNWASGAPTCALGTCALLQGSCVEQGVVPGQNQVCGDGQVTGTEVCDPGATMTKTCRDFNNSKTWASGAPACDSVTCTLLQGTCVEQGTIPGQNQVCGDGQVTGTEACDPGATMTKTCRDFDPSRNWASGAPECTAGTCVLSKGSCVELVIDDPWCGDGFVTSPEVCDPEAPRSQTCSDFDSSTTWAAGTPGCSEDTCTLTIGSCVEHTEPLPVCGDGAITGTEACDPQVIMGKRCSDYNSVIRWKAGGKPGCSAQCHLTKGSCEEELCGNGVVDDGEQCDFGLKSNSAQLSTSKSCATLSPEYVSGTAKCENKCKTLNVSECQKKDSYSGLNYCQLMEPMKIVFEPSTSSFNLNALVSVGGVTDKTTGNDGTIQAELVYGTDYEKMAGSSWKSITASPNNSFTHETIDAYVATLTKSQFDALGADEVFYTFRFREKSSDEWKYCKANSRNTGMIDANIDFIEITSETQTDANKHVIGVAGHTSIDNLIARFTFDSHTTDEKKNASETSDWLSEEGSGRIYGSSKLFCNGACFAVDDNGGMAWNVKGGKFKRADAIKDGAHIIIYSIVTTGLQNIGLDMRVWRNHVDSPIKIAVLYSLDGKNYTELNEDIELKTEESTVGHFYPYRTKAFPEAVNNQPEIWIKLVPFGALDNPLRFDDITITYNHQ